MSIVSPTTQADRDRGILRCLERLEERHVAAGYEIARLRRLIEQSQKPVCPCPAGMSGTACPNCGTEWNY
jgi:RNase P/RNase MRP subunit POP5